MYERKREFLRIESENSERKKGTEDGLVLKYPRRIIHFSKSF